MKVYVYTKRRRSTRFKPDIENQTAKIDTQKLDGKFSPTLTALVLDESFKGCSLVLQNQKGFEMGEICRIQIGSASPTQAEVRWKQKLDETLIKVGFHFLD